MTTVKKGKTKEKPKPEWVSYTEQEYRTAIESMVHQTFKTVNSNAAAGGVRVSSEKAQNVPYIGVTSLLAKGIHVPLEYTKNPVKLSPLYKQINVVGADSEDIIHDPAEAKIIRNELKSVTNKPLVDCVHLSPRLRQILVPKDESYVSLTPISSHGVGQHLRYAILKHHDRLTSGELDKKEVGYIRLASLTVGGTNAQNVGMEVHGIRTPIVGQAPVPESDIAHVLSAYYRGVDLWFPYSLVKSYTTWRNSLKGNISSDLKLRNEHSQWMKMFARFALSLGDDLHELLFNHKDFLPVPKDAGEDFDPLVEMTYLKKKPFDQGLLNPDLRDGKWKDLAAKEIRSKVLAFEKDESRRFEYSAAERTIMLNMIREAL